MINNKRTNGVLENFFSQGKHIFLKRGKIIINPDETPPGVYLIHHGFVRLYTKSAGSGEKLYAIYKEGELFPIPWTFKEAHKPFYYKTLSETVVHEVSRESFLIFMAKSPEIASLFLDRIATQFNILLDRITNLTQANAQEKIIGRLLFFADRFGKHVGEETTIQFPITQSLIADSLALTRETVSREFMELTRKGLIVYKNRSLIIKNRNKLAQRIPELLNFTFLALNIAAWSPVVNAIIQ